jgi:hypothetical protein
VRCGDYSQIRQPPTYQRHESFPEQLCTIGNYKATVVTEHKAIGEYSFTSGKFGAENYCSNCWQWHGEVFLKGLFYQ